ncbi:MAG: rhodanese-like domain-containing protein [Flavobacteriaceae bacterium]
MANLNVYDWKSQLLNDDRAIVLDVRTSDEFQEAAVPNAINVDVKQPQKFLDQINQLDKTHNFYVYCQSGGRSTEACAVLNLLCDIHTTYNLEGGFNAWATEMVTVNN